ncbi:acyl-coenzyme A synthetase/AMP-(fatty) acid ligase [Pullulanibacillus pueri]|uniref:Cyclohexanecarboxylate-CoA ligase n=1 Tax=Pullulanibacillus pueri TaxID=1437324 RepID=A0A8J3EL57_9BACL|nr:AMP-binding protein [Pullulanibacillus pueri]MBM7680729.1 acyl-coenzyme A synthetase/AMP-(fatty) acid ligase [Pullulanibacillus pueri]GGH78108.1 cyclohexanecarboxylate-CoA ligase [Pullulanibacillus pueri]
MVKSLILDKEPLFLETLKTVDPQKEAIVDLSNDTPIILNYGQLEELANRTAQGLLDKGIKPGDFVAYILPNSWEFVVTTLAVWKIGATSCPILPALRDHEVSFILNKSKSKILIVPEEYRNFKYKPMVDRMAPSLQYLESTVVVTTRDPHDKENRLGGLAKEEPNLEALKELHPTTYTNAQLLFTSGTTGEPKGVIHTHGALSFAVHAHTRTLRLTSEDNIWVPSPLAHQTGLLYGMIVALSLGAKQILQAVWNVDTARTAIEGYGATFVQAAMPFLADISRDAHPPKGLRIFVATGAAVPRQLAHDATEALECRVIGGWGSTESCLIAVGSPYSDDDREWGSDGRVIEGLEMKVTDEAGNELPRGEEGMYRVKSPALFKTYLDHHEWYEEAIDDQGFFITGDLATMDEDGYLNLTGRIKDIVNRGGEKIPVVELENILYGHENIKDIAIVGMPDPRLGERICAFVTLKEKSDFTLQDITSFLEAKGVAKIYWPEHLEFIDEQPRTASGKIQKYVLRNMIAEKVAAKA